MPNNMLTEEELIGQRLASELTSKLKMLADERFDEAIKKLNINSSSNDLEKLCASIESAIKSIKSDSLPDTSAIASIQKSIHETRDSSNETLLAIKELIAVAKAPRQIIYDDFGRIIEIRRKVEG